MKEMECLNANKALGHDGLPPSLLKVISKEIVLHYALFLTLL